MPEVSEESMELYGRYIWYNNMVYDIEYMLHNTWQYGSFQKSGALTQESLHKLGVPFWGPYMRDPIALGAYWVPLISGKLHDSNVS